MMRWGLQHVLMVVSMVSQVSKLNCDKSRVYADSDRIPTHETVGKSACLRFCYLLLKPLYTNASRIQGLPCIGKSFEVSSVE